MPGVSTSEGPATGDPLPLSGVPREAVAQATWSGIAPSEGHAAGDALSGPRGDLGWILVRRNIARALQEAGNAPARMPPPAHSARVNNLPGSPSSALGSAPQASPTPGAARASGVSALDHAHEALPVPGTVHGTGPSTGDVPRDEPISVQAPQQEMSQEVSPESSTEHIPLPAHPPSAGPRMPNLAPRYPGSRLLFPPSEPLSPVLHLVPFVPRLPSLATDIQPAASTQDSALGRGREPAVSGTQPQLVQQQLALGPQPELVQQHVASGTEPQVTQHQLASRTQPQVTQQQSASETYAEQAQQQLASGSQPELTQQQSASGTEPELVQQQLASGTHPELMQQHVESGTQPQVTLPQVAQPHVTLPHVTQPQVITQLEPTQRQGYGKVTGQARRLRNLAVALAPFWVPFLLDVGMKALVGLRAAPPAPEAVTWPSPAALEVALLAP